MLHDASLDSSVSDTFLQCECIMTWNKCGCSHKFTHYTTYDAPNYETILFAEQGNHTHRYMLGPILLSSIRTIASMQLNSHAFPCEMGIGHKWWDGRLCTFCLKQARDSECHTLIQCFVFDHIRPCFPNTLTKPNPCTNSLSTTMCTLNRNIHRWSSWTLRVTTHIHMHHVKCNISSPIGHIWPPKMIIEYLSRSLYP